MRIRFACRALAVLLTLCLLLPALAGDEAKYLPKTKYPVIEEMLDTNKKMAAEAQKKTDEILAAIAEQKKIEKEQAVELRFDVSGISRPSGPEAFQAAWHFPPTPQYLTSTCWSFSATSHMESEIKRLHGKEVRLSEMWTAYWEYVQKAEGYIAARGKSRFTTGSEANALNRVYERFGAVPRETFPGVLAEDGRFDHVAIHKGMKAFLEWCKERNYWDEEMIIGSIRAILDSQMGRPPETVVWEGKEYTPQQFYAEVTGLKVDDYVELISTLKYPFFTRAKFDVPDNWWDDESYVNVPLDLWYDTLVAALEAGATVSIGGDVSEPGLYGLHDIALVPSFDIPAEYIDQSARELRMDNETTTDDHGVHAVAVLHLDGHDWFLIKDSNRSSRLGKFKGYYMYRGDYVKLKMMSFGVHKDFVKEILAKVVTE